MASDRYPYKEMIVKESVLKELKEYDEFLKAIKNINADLNSFAYSYIYEDSINLFENFIDINSPISQEDQDNEFDIKLGIVYDKLKELREAFKRRHRGYAIRLEVTSDEAYNFSRNNILSSGVGYFALVDYHKPNTLNLATEVSWIEEF